MKDVTKKITFNLILIILFFLLIWLPNIENIFGFGPEYIKTEKRATQKLPALKMNIDSLINFHNKFVKYYVDNFGFRNMLIRWNSLLKLRVLKIRQFPKVLIGDKGWLYLIKTDERVNTLNYYRSVSPFTDKSIREWVKPLVDINRELKKRGIRYIFVCAPIKHKIYPEYIPEYLHPVREYWRLDQLKKYIKEKTSITLIDLSDAVREGKKEHRVFYKHDVHWNNYGAFYAYRYLIKSLSCYYPQLIPRKFDEYTVKTTRVTGGDLAGMLSLKDMFHEDNFVLMPRFKPVVKSVKLDYRIKKSRLTEAYSVSDQSLPRVVVFHDSFFNFLKPFFTNHFKRSVFIQSYDRFDFTVIEREKPDIVIHEIAESYIEKSPAYITPLNFYDKISSK